ncbi:MAG TPA: ABC transporter substrate-binding protein, partial [Acidimicrobiales bacterium]
MFVLGGPMHIRLRFVAGAICLALLAVACGDDGQSTSPPSTQEQGEQNGNTETDETPKPGGEITFGTFSEAVSLDPVRMTGSGVTGAIELSAIYDTIVRYNPETHDYEMRTAESLEPNDDFTQWTLVLKPGITFGDGTPYDANAVIASIKRHQDPSNPTVSRGTSSVIKEMTAVDDRTVVFTLNEAWAGFPYVLADKVGMIVSPTAVQKYGADFGTPLGYEGAGAGPFVVESYKPKESLVLRKNPNYYGGEVYLDRVTFVNIVGAANTYEALKAGTLQMAFLREASVVAQAVDEGYEGYMNIQQGGGIIAFNHGAVVTCRDGKPESVCAGKPDNTQVATPSPLSSLTVRRALIAAIDPDVLNERVYNG